MVESWSCRHVARCWAVGLLVFAGALRTVTAETLIELGEPWRFFRGRSAPSTPGTAWRGSGFEDAEWESGPSGFGYGDEDDATTLVDMPGSYLSVYIRKSFVVDDPTRLDGLVLEIDFDDGFVAYVNGVEFARSGMGNVGTELSFDAPAFALHEAGDPEQFGLDTRLLRPGNNLIAIEGHNISLESSDFSLAPALRAAACPRFTALRCAPLGNRVELSWNAVPFDHVVVLRNGEELEGSPFDATISTVLDTPPRHLDLEYELVGSFRGEVCATATCSLACCTRSPDALACEIFPAEGGARAELAWSTPPGATSVQVLRQGERIGSLDADRTDFTDTGIPQAGTRKSVSYSVVFGFADGSTCTICCGPVSLCPEALTCRAIRSNGVSAIRLSWSNLVVGWQHFEVLRDGEPISERLPGDSASFVDDTVDVTVDHIYTLLPYTSAGQTGACQRTCLVEAVPCPNTAPTARIAGTSQDLQLCGPASTILDGSASDDGDRGRQGLTYAWTKVSGPPGDVILSADAAETTVEFSAPGAYRYRLDVSDGDSCNAMAEADVDIVVSPCRFVRGDADGDAFIDVTDAIRIFTVLFLGGEPISCLDAADTNDDGRVDRSDGIYLLGVLFLGDRLLPGPGVNLCGVDATTDELSPCAGGTCP